MGHRTYLNPNTEKHLFRRNVCMFAKEATGIIGNGYYLHTPKFKEAEGDFLPVSEGEFKRLRGKPWFRKLFQKPETFYACQNCARKFRFAPRLGIVQKLSNLIPLPPFPPNILLPQPEIVYVPYPDNNCPFCGGKIREYKD
jgi:DNA-directed RNA polymerase subunit RPC12/RpoP